MKQLFILFLFVSVFAEAQKPGSKQLDGSDIQPAIFALSMIMIHDVVNPPAASRYYAYCMMGAYEIVSQNNHSVPPLSSFVRTYTPLKISSAPGAYDYRVAAKLCILETGRLMLPSGHLLEEQVDKMLLSLRSEKISQASIDHSVDVAREVALQVVAYSRSDHYNMLSAMLRYTPTRGEAFWFSTPPAYMEAVEPHWKIIRPMVIDSCNQFVPMAPVKFEKDTSSSFYLLAKEVYDVSRNATKEQLQVAAFWDCNPFAVTTSGHLSIGFKKISPGGHWMNITGIVARTAKLSLDQSVILHTVEALTLTDAFIACWEEKYRSNRVRPETFINRNIDIHWQPLLQSPPFPEYPSGHSVVSTASAEILTYFLGDGFAYDDDSEVIFELPVRSFSSFRQAAREASISRLYGGIHFRDAIETGQQQGRSVALHIIDKIKKAGLKRLNRDSQD